MPAVTLLTDFGTRDHYVGAMKGVICQVAPKATLVDISHDIDPHNVVQAAFVLRHVWPWYPPGTVHLVVVDPGVGSRRRILVGRYGGQYVVAPDNGVVTLVHRELPLEALHLAENTQHFLPSVSPTFHGRDIMAPIAARLSDGLNIAQVGPPTDHVEVLQLARSNLSTEYGTVGRVLHVDRFGNLVTNILREDLASTFRHRRDAKVYVGDTCVGPIRSCYDEVAPGEPLALIGSTELLEIAVCRGSAAEHFQPAAETTVEVR